MTTSPLPIGWTEAPLAPPTIVPAMEALPLPPPEGATDVGVDGETGDFESALLHPVAETASTIAINAKNLRMLILHHGEFTRTRRDRTTQSGLI